MASGEDLELARPQFENHRTCDSRLLARTRPDALRETTDHRFGLGQRYVLLKGVLSGYRLRRSVLNDSAIVNATGEFVQTHTIPAKLVFQCRQIQILQLTYCSNSQASKLLSGHPAYARQASNGQRR